MLYHLLLVSLLLLWIQKHLIIVVSSSFHVIIRNGHVHGHGDQQFSFIPSTTRTPTTGAGGGGGCFRKRLPCLFALSPSSRETTSSTTGSGDKSTTSNNNNNNKQRLLELIAQTPRNAPTPQSLTSQILQVVREVEADCPFANNNDDDTDEATFLGKLKGTWDLLWTCQDPNSREAQRGPLFSYINPLENQSYSNNPERASSSSSSTTGRANPLLPRGIQDRLEAAGILPSSNKNDNNNNNNNDPGGGGGGSGGFLNPASTQTISLSRRQVRNVVTFNNRGNNNNDKTRTTRPTTLTVTIDFQVPPPPPVPNNARQYNKNVAPPTSPPPPRRIDVTFTSCRVVVPPLRLDFVIPLQSPLGLLRPIKGWLRTTYLDDDFRITRGHKGSVFILARPSAATVAVAVAGAGAGAGAAGGSFNESSSSTSSTS